MGNLSRRYARAVAITGLVFLPGLSLAEAQTLTLKTEFHDVRPRYIREPSGGWTGLNAELIELVSRDTGIVFSHPDFIVPMERVLRNLETGATDIHFGLVVTPEREKKYNIGEGLYPVSARIIVRKDDPFPARRLEDIPKLEGGTKVLAVFGMQMVKELMELKLDVDDGGRDFESNMQKLVSGRGRCFVFSNLSILYEMEQSPLKDSVRIVDADFLVKEEHVMFSPKVPPEIVEKINESIRRLKKTDKWRKVLKKYMP